MYNSYHLHSFSQSHQIALSFLHLFLLKKLKSVANNSYPDSANFLSANIKRMSWFTVHYLVFSAWGWTVAPSLRTEESSSPHPDHWGPPLLDSQISSYYLMKNNRHWSSSNLNKRPIQYTVVLNAYKRPCFLFICSISLSKILVFLFISLS